MLLVFCSFPLYLIPKHVESHLLATFCRVYHSTASGWNRLCLALTFFLLQSFLFSKLSILSRYGAFFRTKCETFGFYFVGVMEDQTVLHRMAYDTLKLIYRKCHKMTKTYTGFWRIWLRTACSIWYHEYSIWLHMVAYVICYHINGLMLGWIDIVGLG